MCGTLLLRPVEARPDHTLCMAPNSDVRTVVGLFNFRRRTRTCLNQTGASSSKIMLKGRSARTVGTVVLVGRSTVGTADGRSAGSVGAVGRSEQRTVGAVSRHLTAVILAFTTTKCYEPPCTQTVQLSHKQST